MTFDSMIAAGIVIGAVFYLYRKFTKSDNGGCSCSSGGGCCGSHHQVNGSHCCSSKH